MRMRYARMSGLVVALAVTGVAAAPATAQRPAQVAGTSTVTATVANGLADELDTALTDPRLTGSDVGLIVRDPAGNVLYTRNGDKRFVPGSNNKLLVSAAAVDGLGLNYTFTTSVVRSGTVTNKVLNGDLFLKGTGDPSITAAGYDALATKVAAAGITKVTGGLVADDTWFDNSRLGTEWAWDDEPYSYAAEISALTIAADSDLNTGVVGVSMGPGAAVGKPAVVTLSPANDYAHVVDNAVTSAAGSARTISVTRAHGTNNLVVTGSVPLAGSTSSSLRTVDEPELLAASVFRAALARHGVAVAKPTRTGTAAGATVVASSQSGPLSSVLPYFLKLSNNGHAEILLKALGRKVSGQGTSAAGIAAVGTFLTANGVDKSVLNTADASGLSRQDLVTPAQVTKLLTAVKSKSWFPTWYAALPIAGQPDRLVGGTLASRMAGTAAANNLHGKTGSLTGVSALSGYVSNKDGLQLTFSMFTNDYVAPSVKSLEDTVAVLIANSGGSATTAKADVAKLRKAQVVPDDPRTPVDESALECSWVGRC
ncbi:MAG: hypothetical protein QOI35_2348 [Cryptosporangiaceae bacterium]|nr:hypothetical protein [Cryptosporangiaceae bacterium]